jgi:hypothetical protein
MSYFDTQVNITLDSQLTNLLQGIDTKLLSLLGNRHSPAAAQALSAEGGLVDVPGDGDR